VKTRRVFVVGDSLFAETLTQMLTKTGNVHVIGSAPTPDTAVSLLADCQPDAVIMAGDGEMATPAFGQLLSAYPDLPMIYADLSKDNVQVITSHSIGTRTADLLAAVGRLPRRG